MNIEISVVDKQELLEHGKKRSFSKCLGHSRRVYGIKNRVFADLDKLTVDYIGLKGELAVERGLGIKMDRNIYSGGDNGDGCLADGTQIVIKYNHRSNGHLMINRRSDFPDESIGILTQGLCAPNNCQCRKMDSSESIKIAGWIKGSDFWRICSRSDWGVGNRWWIPQSRLKPIRLLRSRIYVEEELMDRDARRLWEEPQVNEVF
jgi:hypothetical protein